MQAFPGTTRDYWLNEEAGFVQRAQIVLDEQAKHQKLLARRAGRR